MNTVLARQQQQLQAAIVGAAPAAGLLHIYQHAYSARLLGALRDNFGVLPRAIGDEAFDALGHAYLRAHPPREPSIRWFGHALAGFMAQQPELVPHPAFVDLARMEWALRAAFDAADGADFVGPIGGCPCPRALGRLGAALSAECAAAHPAMAHRAGLARAATDR